jgi:hypothetical protein
MGRATYQHDLLALEKVVGRHLVHRVAHHLFWFIVSKVREARERSTRRQRVKKGLQSLDTTIDRSVRFGGGGWWGDTTTRTHARHLTNAVTARRLTSLTLTDGTLAPTLIVPMQRRRSVVVVARAKKASGEEEGRRAREAVDMMRDRG